MPQDPLTLKLRLDTNDAKHRPYGAADTLSRCLRRILFGPSETELKINLISVVASDATFA